MTTRKAKPAPLPTNRLTTPPSWLVFVYQLAGEPSRLRVRTWRRLQQLGALPVKQAVYVVPDSPRGREDFAWLKTEIEGAGGEVTVFTAHTIDPWEHDALVHEFRRTRTEAYQVLAQEAAALLRRASKSRVEVGSTRKASERIRERLTTLTDVDFFDAPGRDAVLSLLTEIDERVSPAPKAGVRGASRLDVADYRKRTWITRPRPGVDRMASAWLIRRFIDAEARFVFATNPDDLPGSVPFDMSGVEFSHHAANCTFETLCALFGLTDPALAMIAALVHDLDLKDERFGAPDAAAIGGLIEGLQLAIADDGRLLDAGMMLFEAQYRSLAKRSRSSSPRIA